MSTQKSDEANVEKKKKCFIVMPIADMPGYEAGHFTRVYKHLIKPACENAGFEVTRADDTKSTNVIILDILSQIYHADMVICDVSGKNPNVMYELGLRHAFGLPTVLIKDTITNRIFDTSSIRDVEYEHSLRVDTVGSKIDEISEAIKKTYADSLSPKEGYLNSVVALLGVSPAKVDKREVSPETLMILETVSSLKHSVYKLVNDNSLKNSLEDRNLAYHLDEQTQTSYKVGDYVLVDGDEVGHVISLGKNTATIRMSNGLTKRAHYPMITPLEVVEKDLFLENQ